MPITSPVNIRDAWRVFTEAPDERSRMGQIAGILWMTAAIVGVVCAFLPGARHGPIGWIIGVCAVVFLYGLSSAAHVIHWERASITVHAIGTALTLPIIGVAVYLMGDALAYIEPLFVVPLLYATFFFPRRWAWFLSVELLVIAGVPLLTDPHAIDEAFLPHYVALWIGFLAAAWVIIGLKERLSAAELHQREMAHTDPLTGVSNRRAFDQRVRVELATRDSPNHARRDSDHQPLALLIFDLNDFKAINDSYGHATGDAVLRRVAKSSSKVVRSSDTLARIGGDEFAVIAPGADEAAAERLAKSICATVAASGGHDLPQHEVSAGWAVFPEDGDDYETLLHAADARMMETKRERAPALR